MLDNNLKKRLKGEAGDLPMSEVIPRPIVNFKTADDGLVVIYKPKFKNKFLAKHLLPRMKRPDYKIGLDKNGSAVWKLIDGKRDALEIAEMLEKEFGVDIQPVYERLGIFLRMLKNSKLIDF